MRAATRSKQPWNRRPARPRAADWPLVSAVRNRSVLHPLIRGPEACLTEIPVFFFLGAKSPLFGSCVAAVMEGGGRISGSVCRWGPV